MGLMDDIEGKLGSEAKQRFNELKQKLESGQLNDEEKKEFERLKSKL